MTDTLYKGYNPELNVELIGCGGTGAYVAEQVCRLQQQMPGRLTLIDHDLVEPHNLLRQNFLPADIDKPKSKVLAERLSNAFQRKIEYSTTKLTTKTVNQSQYHSRSNTIMVGCVDNAAARAAMHLEISRSSCLWLIDSGNDSNWGQILIGNQFQQRRQSHQDETCYKAPAPLLQRPDLLETPDQPEPTPQDCAEAVINQDQSPVINQVMASLVVQTLFLIKTAACTYMALYIDLPNGSVRPVPASQENIKRTYRGLKRYHTRHPNLLEDITK